MTRQQLGDKKIDWRSIRAVIFDVDGTLYDQRVLRGKMIKELLRYYIRHPWKVYELKILQDFRRAREVHSHTAVSDVEHMQYVWGAERSHVAPERVRELVEEWLLRRPLKHLRSCRYSGVEEFLSLLRRRDIKIAFFSDYPILDKLNALGLSPAPSFVATDPCIDCFKPNLKGTLFVVDTIGVAPSDCVMIGDRDDREGEVARRAGMRYILIGKHGKSHRRSYSELIAELT